MNKSTARQVSDLISKSVEGYMEENSNTELVSILKTQTLEELYSTKKIIDRIIESKLIKSEDKKTLGAKVVINQRSVLYRTYKNEPFIIIEVSRDTVTIKSEDGENFKISKESVDMYDEKVLHGDEPSDNGDGNE